MFGAIHPDDGVGLGIHVVEEGGRVAAEPLDNRSCAWRLRGACVEAVHGSSPKFRPSLPKRTGSLDWVMLESAWGRII